MAFNVGDVVYILAPESLRKGKVARIEHVLPKRHSVQDFQEYVVEFPEEKSQKFQYCLYRECELRVLNSDVS